MEPITYNNNPNLTWYRLDCYRYAVLNKNPAELPMNILVAGGGYTHSFDIAFGQTISFDLPKDGVYDFTATILSGSETVPTVYEGLLIELCALTLCWLKLYQQLYCTDCEAGQESPCANACKDTGFFGPPSNEDKERARNGIRQLQAMFFSYMSQVYEYNLKYTGLEVPVAERAAKRAAVKRMWNQVLSFTESCGFDCTSGADGQSTGCKNCQ